MFGYPFTQVTGQILVKVGLPEFGWGHPAKPKSTRKSDQKYPNMTKSILHDPEFDVDSKYVFKTMLGGRNLELRLPIETAGQASQLDIPALPDRTEPIFELTIEFCPTKPKLLSEALPCGENKPQWLNSLLFFW